MSNIPQRCFQAVCGNLHNIEHILMTQVSGHNWLDNVELGKGLWHSLLGTPANFNSLEKIEADFELNGRKIMLVDEVDFGGILDSIGASAMMDFNTYETMKEQFANLLFELLASRKE